MVWPAGQGGSCSKSRCWHHNMLWLWSMQHMASLHVQMSGAVAAGCSSCLQSQQRAALDCCSRDMVTVSIMSTRMHPQCCSTVEVDRCHCIQVHCCSCPQSGGSLGALTALPALMEAVLLQTV